MHEVKINRNLLEKLRMLADWQVAEKGFDPVSVAVACVKCDETQPSIKPKSKFFPT